MKSREMDAVDSKQAPTGDRGARDPANRFQSKSNQSMRALLHRPTAIRTKQLSTVIYGRTFTIAYVPRCSTCPPCATDVKTSRWCWSISSKMFQERVGRNVPGIEEDALGAMMNHSWPGSVREFANAIEGIFTFTRASQIRLQDLPRTIGAIQPPRLSAATAFLQPAPQRVPSLAEVERNLIASVLENTRGNKVAAAELLGISHKKRYAKIAK
jgi:Bacterial regulatory protein, Fis family